MGIYKDVGIANGKPRWIIVDGHRRTINKYPSKEELKSANKWDFKYNDTNACYICEISFDDAIGHPLREYDEDKKKTGMWICQKCYWIMYGKRSDSAAYLRKQLTNYRTGNQDPNSEQAKGDNSQELACRLYRWEDLNKKHDNRKSSVDCCDPKTGLYHQVQGRYYNSRNEQWPFGNFEREWKKIFESMVCFCYSEDGKIVERIYIFPKKEIDFRKGLIIVKNPTDSHSNPKISWYDKYRITDEDELKKANAIWKEIISKKIL